MTEIKFEQRPDDTSGAVSTGLRESWPVEREETEDGERRTFLVSEEVGEDSLRRLVEAGHRCLEPDLLPFEYEEPAEEGESGDESDPITVTAEDTSEPERGSEPSGEAPEPAGEVSAEDLDAMDRSELYQLGNSEFGREWKWGGEGALSEEEMRAELKEEI